MKPKGSVPGGFDGDRLAEQIASAVFRPDVVPVPDGLMKELGYPKTTDEFVKRQEERWLCAQAMEALGGVVIGPSADQLDWLLARYLRAQPFTDKALPSRVTVLELMTWLRKEGR